jgi:hypothetical protein
LEQFPLGRPFADGSRRPMHYCYDCLSEHAITGEPLLGGGAEARRRAGREAMRRHRTKAA